MILLLSSVVQAFLNVPPNTPSDLVEHMQRRIYIDSKLVTDKPSICSSMEGPNCFNNAWSSVGPVPEITTVGFSDLYHLFTPEIWASLPSIPQASHAAGLTNFQFADQILGKKLPPFYSSGLPRDLVASWDGRWLVDAESGGAAAISLASFLPGYLRFSQPVLLRRLWLEIPDSNVSVYVMLRRGTQTVWMSRKFVGFSDHTIDVCEFGIDGHSPTMGVDEISVFTSGVGVKIAKMEMLHASQVLIPGLVLAKTQSDRLLAKPTLIDQNLIDGKFFVSLYDAVKERRELKAAAFQGVDLDLFAAAVTLGDMDLVREEMAKSNFNLVPPEPKKALVAASQNSGAESSDPVLVKRRQVANDLFLAALLHV